MGSRGTSTMQHRPVAMTLVYLAIAFTLGIAASTLAGHVLRPEGLPGCQQIVWSFPAAVVSLIALLFLLRERGNGRQVVAFVLFLVLGAWRYTASPFDHCWTERDLAFYQSDVGVWATIEGEVTAFPDVRDRATYYELAVARVIADGLEHRVRGKAMVEAPRYPLYRYGDTLRITGRLLAPPVSDDFDYRRFLAIRNIHTLIRRPAIERTAANGGKLFWRVLYRVRSHGAAITNRIMPEPAAALTNGMVLGIEGGISKEVDEAFKATGTTHLIVISGSNIALLAGALAGLLGHFLPRRRAALAAAPLVLLYVLLVGADPPALRAGVMGMLALGAVYFGRRGTAYVSLCAAGLVMLALNPLTLWDVGFQLSFMTSLGLILFSRPLSHALLSGLHARLPADVARRWAGLVEGTLIVTIAAQVAVLPLILSYFGRLSPVSLLTNALVLPVQPAILAGGILAILAGAAWLPFGQLLGTLPWLLLSYTVGVVRASAAIPFASLDTGRAGLGFAIGYYALLALSLALPRIARVLRRQPELGRASAWTAFFAVPFCVLFFAWRAQPDGRLHLVFVPGTDGEAAVIVAPGGRVAWLWDGRGDGEALVDATRSGGWVRGRPDIVMADCGANPWSGTACIDPGELPPGGAIALVEGLHVTRLNESDPPALLLSYGEFSSLLPSTLPPALQESLEAASRISLLKAPGPGTGAWPTVGYLRSLQPQLVLWPSETTYPPDVAWHLASEVTVARVEARAVVEVITDGQRFWLTRHSAESPR